MRVRVLFFGSTAALTNERQLEIESADESNARPFFDLVLAQFPQLRDHKLLFSVNQQYATGEELVRDGDEIAIFTAVSGG